MAKSLIEINVFDGEPSGEVFAISRALSRNGLDISNELANLFPEMAKTDRPSMSARIARSGGLQNRNGIKSTD